MEYRIYKDIRKEVENNVDDCVEHYNPMDGEGFKILFAIGFPLLLCWICGVF